MKPLTKRTKALAALAAAAALLLAVPTAVTGAFWTASQTASAQTSGSGTWCATPDPAADPRLIRLADIPGNGVRLVIIPVANNTAWGAGTGTRQLGVRLWSCQEQLPPTSLRISSWANATSVTGLTWLQGSTPAPVSRLDPATGYGLQLANLARFGDPNATQGGAEVANTGTSNAPARRYSWILTAGRSRDSDPVFEPGCRGGVMGLVSCHPLLGSTSAAAAYPLQTWTGPAAPNHFYAAGTYAQTGSGGWARDGLNGLLRFVSRSDVLMEPNTTNDMTTTNGNLMQWVVIEWSGTDTPPPDMLAEIVLQ